MKEISHLTSATQQGGVHTLLAFFHSQNQNRLKFCRVTTLAIKIIYIFFSFVLVEDEDLPQLASVVVFTTRGALFAEGPGHSAKAQKPSAKALPSAALGKEPSEKKLTAKRFFAEGYLSGTRQSLFRGSTAALGKKKQLSTALLC